MPNVLVSGSSRGIGLAIAKAFCESGFRVVMNCKHDAEKLKKEADAIGAIGIRADVSSYDEANRLFNEVGKTMDGIDILVNNAGVSSYGLFSDTNPADWKAVMDTNFMSALNCASLAVPAMLKKKNGVIINISSVWGTAGASCEAVYSASKGAVNAFTKALGKELAPSGIRVNAIACGVIDTSMNNFLSDDEKSELIERIPAGRYGSPEEVAALAVFLASDQAKYINGQIITIDGAWL